MRTGEESLKGGGWEKLIKHLEAQSRLRQQAGPIGNWAEPGVGASGREGRGMGAGPMEGGTRTRRTA